MNCFSSCYGRCAREIDITALAGEKISTQVTHSTARHRGGCARRNRIGSLVGVLAPTQCQFCKSGANRTGKNGPAPREFYGESGRRGRGAILARDLGIGRGWTTAHDCQGENKPVETTQVSMATIRDSILTVLAQCTSEQLLTPQGKAKLKADLLNSLNRDVPDLRAREVYFTEFLVQR